MHLNATWIYLVSKSCLPWVGFDSIITTSAWPLLEWVWWKFHVCTCVLVWIPWAWIPSFEQESCPSHPQVGRQVKQVRALKSLACSCLWSVAQVQSSPRALTANTDWHVFFRGSHRYSFGHLGLLRQLLLPIHNHRKPLATQNAMGHESFFMPS